MLRVTLNSSCVQFASEIERTDVFLVKIINNMCSVIFVFPPVRHFYFPRMEKEH